MFHKIISSKRFYVFDEETAIFLKTTRVGETADKELKLYSTFAAGSL